MFGNNITIEKEIPIKIAIDEVYSECCGHYCEYKESSMIINGRPKCNLFNTWDLKFHNKELRKYIYKEGQYLVDLSKRCDTCISLFSIEEDE
jgi:hypothetical protein